MRILEEGGDCRVPEEDEVDRLELVDCVLLFVVGRGNRSAEAAVCDDFCFSTDIVFGGTNRLGALLFEFVRCLGVRKALTGAAGAEALLSDVGAGAGCSCCRSATPGLDP